MSQIRDICQGSAGLSPLGESARICTASLRLVLNRSFRGGRLFQLRAVLQYFDNLFKKAQIPQILMGFDLKGIFRNLLPARPQAPAMTVHQLAAWEHGQGLFREMLSTYGVHDRLQSGQTLETVAIDLSNAVLASPQKERKFLFLYLNIQTQSDSQPISLDEEIGRETWKVIRIKHHRKLLMADAAILKAVIQGGGNPAAYYKMAEGLYEDMRPFNLIRDEFARTFFDLIPAPSTLHGKLATVFNILSPVVGETLSYYEAPFFPLLMDLTVENIKEELIDGENWLGTGTAITDWDPFSDDDQPLLKAGMSPKEVRILARYLFDQDFVSYETLLELWKKILPAAKLPEDLLDWDLDEIKRRLPPERLDNMVRQIRREKFPWHSVSKDKVKLFIDFPWSLKFYPFASVLDRSLSFLGDGVHFFITGYHQPEDSIAESPIAHTPRLDIQSF